MSQTIDISEQQRIRRIIDCKQAGEDKASAAEYAWFVRQYSQQVLDFTSRMVTDIADAEDDIAEDTMYLTLNLARVYAWQQEGKVLSKKEGGEWGLKNLPEKHHELLRKALSEYRGETPGYDIGAAKEYAGAMLRLIGNNMQPQNE